MTDFYQLPPEEQADCFKKLAVKALDSWDMDPDAAPELIKHRENAVYKVTAAGRQYVLRIHRFGYHTDDALRSELQWMEALSQDGIPTPDIVRTRKGEPFTRVEVAVVPEPRQVDLFAWINGVPISEIEDRNDELSMHRQIGTLMARMHNQAGRWTPPMGFTRHSWDVEGLLGSQPVWGRFWEMSHFSHEQREKIHEARVIAEDFLKAFGQGPDRYGLIHCDFLPENMLKNGDEVRIIDFDDCGYGWHMFDIVTSLFNYTHLPNFESIKNAFMEGYRSQRNLSDELLTCFDFFLLLRVMTSCGWLHTRSETETARQFSAVLAEDLMVKVDSFLKKN